MKLYQYIAAWGTPCISPYVTKVVNYMKMTGIDCDIVQQDLGTLGEDAPRGKLPYLVLDDGSKVCDSNEIIAYFKQTRGDPLDAHLSAVEKAQSVAWTRLCDEHLYWSGVIQPRWREDAGWETYIPAIVGGAEVGPELREALDAFRVHIVEEFNLQGMGGRTDEEVFDIYRVDIDALSDYLGDKPWFMGDAPTTVDATVYSYLRHTMYVPFEWPGREYALAKANFVSYCARFRETYAI